ncbi:hypothetical protein WJX84_004720 [Apatococcus fuscideae]|uniref:Uncharacterized protein n=1 Tax=Apatococcus fuscideae TaxID=2026836 RepID=A0AAW1TEF0_9CHLO
MRAEQRSWSNVSWTRNLLLAALLLVALTAVKGSVRRSSEETSSAMASSTDQTEWPALVGMDANQAQSVLEKETSKTVFLVPVGNMVTMDYRPERVRIFYDSTTNKVAKVPKIG